MKSNVIPIRREVSKQAPEHGGGDSGGGEYIRIILEIEGLEELEAQDHHIDTVDEEPKKRRGWLWFLIGVALGLGL